MQTLRCLYNFSPCVSLFVHHIKFIADMLIVKYALLPFVLLMRNVDGRLIRSFMWLKPFKQTQELTQRHIKLISCVVPENSSVKHKIPYVLVPSLGGDAKPISFYHEPPIRQIRLISKLLVPTSDWI